MCVRSHPEQRNYPILLNMPNPSTDLERRTLQRLSTGEIGASLRLRGRLSSTSVNVVDFNRYGMAILFDQPLPKDKVIYLSLRYANLCLDNVIGVIHNCMRHDDLYRCGIRFRTQSTLQFDKRQVEQDLLLLEKSLVNAADSAKAG